MTFRTILVDLREDSARAARIEAAARLAMLFDGSVVGLTATGTQLEPFRGAGEDAGKYAALAAGTIRRLAAEHHAVLQKLVKQVGPSIPARQVLMEAEAGWALATEGRFADLILPALPLADESVPAPMAKAAEYALLNSGRPVMLVPGKVGLHVPGRIVIGWNGSREAARAVADALPMLRLASRVSIVVIATGEGESDDDGVRLTTWLASHDVEAALHVEDGGDPDHALLRVARDLQADLLVAGGYGRPRLSELVLGGTTRALTRQSEMPVFMSH
ncbi:universal stress protein [Cupriavidus lacunae]|uniref:Universal stress protein n=1 Tax=Cupriavidus lacunae TaxID=2666307 RepID=A0A370NL98_9BURK|nr:universal stress protein [Cupriavidus lacunae]RDK06375.1 universal stress protein [Cupriavidus lacunae]